MTERKVPDVGIRDRISHIRTFKEVQQGASSQAATSPDRKIFIHDRADTCWGYPERV